jgi:hypothetical protein
MQRFVSGRKISGVSLWSDGPASQWKNRYLYKFMNNLVSRYSLSILQWNFFAASHGKGPVDGVGAIAKKTVWNAVKSRKCRVSSAQDFCGVLNKVENRSLEAINVQEFFEEEWVNRATEDIQIADEVSRVLLQKSQ